MKNSGSKVSIGSLEYVSTDVFRIYSSSMVVKIMVKKCGIWHISPPYKTRVSILTTIVKNLEN
jgi:hypothetical protein